MSRTVYEDSETTVENAVVEVRDATVRFGMERGESRVLDGVDVDLRRNEILGVVGESGSGKSMFASALLDAVDEPGVLTGEVTYRPADGAPVDVLDLSEERLRQYRWEQVSMVFQGAMRSFNPVRKIRTHFVETLTAHDTPVPAGMERAKRLLSDLFLDPDRVLDAYPHELSGGMRQRTLIALSLLLDPEVLVMDEPTAALDLLMQRSIISLLERLKEKYDLTIVFITHDLSLVANLADRLAVLYAFEFVEIGPAEEILRGSVHPYTRSLLNATPNLETSEAEMEPIEGSSPDPIDTPQGCSYHPRCPLADEQCVQEDPDAYPVDDDHHVHCHHWEAVPESIPLAFLDRDDDTWTRTTAGGDSVNRAGAEPVVSLDGVDVHFEGESSSLNPFADPPTVRAVDDVSLDIHDNDVVVLVGESGCGKTTLGKVAVGLQDPTGGTVEYKGQDIWRARRRLGNVDIPFEDIRKALQVIHQDPGSSLNDMRRVKASLAEPLKRWHANLGSEERLDLLAAMLRQVGMTPPEDYMERYPHQLSGGEKQRVALVRAMLMNPELILADEPVSALDVSLRVEMMDMMVELQEMFDTSFLFVSHDLSNAKYIASKMDGRIAIMYLGEIVEIGPPDRVINDPRHPYTKALRWATADLDPDAADGGTTEAPVRDIDIPDPENPPRGCRYHTRCSSVIPPEAYDLDQPEWNAVMDLKVAVERGGFDYETVADTAFGPDTDFHDAPPADRASGVRRAFEIPPELSDPDAERALTSALDRIADRDLDGAERLLNEEFETICQRQSPQSMLDDEAGRTGGAACFLEADEYGTAPSPN